MNSERRRHARVDVDVDVEVSVQLNKKHYGRVTNVSEAGLFVETSNHVELGDFVVLSLSDQKIMFSATVRRVVANGFGAEFGSMSDAHREVISRFIPKPEQAKVSSVVQMPTVMLLAENRWHSILEHLLKEAGFAVLELISIDKVISSMQRFDVACVVSDYIFSGTDTLSIFNKIKEEQPLDAPVIIYSGRHDIPYKKFEELGIQCFSKSITSPRKLVSHIKKSISENHNSIKMCGVPQ
ncbi:MAG: PilZ domain-containing protein [Dissulfurispiraceae bacterium]